MREPPCRVGEDPWAVASRSAPACADGAGSVRVLTVSIPSLGASPDVAGRTLVDRPTWGSDRQRADRVFIERASSTCRLAPVDW